MAFITQELSENCGAYCLAYWYWLEKEERQANYTNYNADAAFVDNIYNLIIFNANAPATGYGSINDYSNPVDMITLLGLEVFGNAKCNYYTGDNKLSHSRDVFTIYSNMTATANPQSKRIKHLKGQGCIIENLCITTLENGQYAILICLCYDKDDLSLEGLHYVLVKKQDDKYVLYNPWKGISEDINESFLKSESRVEHGDIALISSGAGILIPAPE